MWRRTLSESVEFAMTWTAKPNDIIGFTVVGMVTLDSPFGTALRTNIGSNDLSTYNGSEEKISSSLLRRIPFLPRVFQKLLSVFVIHVFRVFSSTYSKLNILLKTLSCIFSCVVSYSVFVLKSVGLAIKFSPSSFNGSDFVFVGVRPLLRFLADFSSVLKVVAFAILLNMFRVIGRIFSLICLYVFLVFRVILLAFFSSVASVRHGFRSPIRGSICQ